MVSSNLSKFPLKALLQVRSNKENGYRNENPQCLVKNQALGIFFWLWMMSPYIEPAQTFNLHFNDFQTSLIDSYFVVTIRSQGVSINVEFFAVGLNGNGLLKTHVLDIA